MTTRPWATFLLSVGVVAGQIGETAEEVYQFMLSRDPTTTTI